MKTFNIRTKNQNDIQQLTVSEFEKLFNIRYLPIPSHQKGLKQQCPYILRIPFLASENWDLGKRYCSLLREGYFANVSIRWISGAIGFGLFTEQDLSANSYVGEYTGKIRMLNKKAPNHNAYCVHYPTRFWSKKYFVIDALSCGNEARFINHSEHPNLAVKCLIKDYVLHFVFFTLTAIKKGEELTVNYGTDFWKKRNIIDY